MEYTEEMQEKMRAFLATHTLSSGLGDMDKPCSLGAFNVVIYDTLNARCPDCMSLLVSQWVVAIQDLMPDNLRNAAEWKAALLQAYGTGNEFEQKRCNLIIDWMWDVVLPAAQSVANNCGFGQEWAVMCKEKRATEIGTVLEARSASNDAALVAHADINAIPRNMADEVALELRRYNVVNKIAGIAATIASWVGPEIWEKIAPANLLQKLCRS